MSKDGSDSDSDYIVEEYIKPDKVAVPVKNGEKEDLLGNFKDIQKEPKIYGTFPKEVFDDSFDHDTKLDLLEGKWRDKWISPDLVLMNVPQPFQRRKQNPNRWS